MSERVELLSKATNYAVVQLPGRKFPGVVVQGDSLHGIVQLLAKLRALAKAHNDEELTEGLAELHDLLQESSKRYEAVCKERGITLPYPTT
jgi:uncharacterized protein DUF6959